MNLNFLFKRFFTNLQDDTVLKKIPIYIRIVVFNNKRLFLTVYTTYNLISD